MRKYSPLLVVPRLESIQSISMKKSLFLSAITVLFSLISCAPYPAQATPQQYSQPPAQTMSMPSNKKPEPKDFVGLTHEVAQKLADQHKIRHRVVMLDGKSLPVTRDYRPERLNFTVNKGMVTKVTNG